MLYISECLYILRLQGRVLAALVFAMKSASCNLHWAERIWRASLTTACFELSDSWRRWAVSTHPGNNIGDGHPKYGLIMQYPNNSHYHPIKYGIFFPHHSICSQHCLKSIFFPPLSEARATSCGDAFFKSYCNLWGPPFYSITHDTYPRPEMLQVKNAQTFLFALLNQSSCRLALALNNGSFSSCIQTTRFGDRWDGPKQLQIQRAGARFQGILHEVCGADLRGSS